MLSPHETSAIITGYVGAIGDVEQHLPGEEQILDPLLRRAPEAEPGHRPEGLPGDLAAPGLDEHPASGPKSPATRGPLSMEAKRALLERALQQRIAAAELSPSL